MVEAPSLGGFPHQAADVLFVLCGASAFEQS
jgi:hypothetical protein